MMHDDTAAILVKPHTELALSLTRDAIVLERGQVVHRARQAEFAHEAAALERFVGLRIESAG
jgi:branched-chain amino acid transport system ATP-binding protein